MPSRDRRCGPGEKGLGAHQAVFAATAHGPSFQLEHEPVSEPGGLKIPTGPWRTLEGAAHSGHRKGPAEAQRAALNERGRDSAGMARGRGRRLVLTYIIVMLISVCIFCFARWSRGAREACNLQPAARGKPDTKAKAGRSWRRGQTLKQKRR